LKVIFNPEISETGRTLVDIGLLDLEQILEESWTYYLLEMYPATINILNSNFGKHP
jgi:hypothetical protein